METAVITTDLNSELLKEADFLYFGNEFCDKLIPSAIETEQAVQYCGENKKKFVLLTPPCNEKTLDKLKRNLSILPPGTELVVNDWGVLGFLQNSGFKLTLGRLMTRQKKPAHLWEIDVYRDYFSKSSCSNQGYVDFIKKAGITRVEFDNTPFLPSLAEHIPCSVYYPLTYVSTSLNCVLAKAFKLNESECGQICKRLFLTEISLKDSQKIVNLGKAQFYDFTDKYWENSNIFDRLVLNPDYLLN